MRTRGPTPGVGQSRGMLDEKGSASDEGAVECRSTADASADERDVDQLVLAGIGSLTKTSRTCCPACPARSPWRPGDGRRARASHADLDHLAELKTGDLGWRPPGGGGRGGEREREVRAGGRERERRSSPAADQSILPGRTDTPRVPSWSTRWPGRALRSSCGRCRPRRSRGRGCRRPRLARPYPAPWRWRQYSRESWSVILLLKSR